MSIANELHWTTAAKPKFGKATEHSGAKKGKGAWDTKKVAKKTSNKGRRAADKKASQDTTVGDESDGPFPGAAPLFKKAAAMHWTTAEPRPCYPSEEPVEDHCNEGIAPPAPGGGDDMGSSPPKGFSEQEQAPLDWDTYEGFDPQEETVAPWRTPKSEQGPQDDTVDDDEFFDVSEDPMENADPSGPVSPSGHPLDLQNPLDPQGPGGSGHDWGVDPEDPGPFSDDPMSPDYRNPWFDSDEFKQGMEKDWQEETVAPWRTLKSERKGQAPQAPQGPQGNQMTGPHDARDPALSPDAPHQFWAQESPTVQEALNKYLMPQLNSPNPGIAEKAKRILMEGPHVE